VLSGHLSALHDVAVVPLEGPGAWLVTASAPTSITLECQGSSITVGTQFEIAAHQQCQVTISPGSATTSLTWQFLPSH
jgi:hypothetical protein